MKALPGLLLALAISCSAWADDGKTTTVLTTRGIDAEETTFGDLATDALCDAAGVTIALAPAVAFKPGQIAPGPVKVKAVAKLLHEPKEKWAVVKLTGAQIRAAIERSVSFAPTPRVFFLQVSGLKIVYNPRAPRGRKVKSIKMGFTEISDTAKYEVAMPEGLAKGGTGYFTILRRAPRVRTGTEGLAKTIHGYVKAKGTVSYTGQGRIVVGK